MNGTEGLAADAQGGDAAAYEDLFARVARRLLAYVQIRLGDRLRSSIEPMDVLQETYLAAHRAFPNFRSRGPGAFTAWLFHIADNRLRDLADYFGAEKRRALREAVRDSQIIRSLRDEVSGPRTESARREQRQQLVEAMAGLDVTEREALLLRFFHGLTLQAIADRLGVSEPTVRRLLARGQIRLGRHLRGLDT